MLKLNATEMRMGFFTAKITLSGCLDAVLVVLSLIAIILWVGNPDLRYILRSLI